MGLRVPLCQNFWVIDFIGNPYRIRTGVATVREEVIQPPCCREPHSCATSRLYLN